jgi:hypothetical protein
MAIEDPSIGYGCEFWLKKPAGVLTELVGVTNIVPPNDQAERVETTHYKSPQRRKQYIAGLLDAADTTIEMNYAPGSPTDLLCQSAKNLVCDFKMVILDAEGDDWEITGTCTVRGYERTLPVGGVKKATLTISYNGAIAEAAAA